MKRITISAALVVGMTTALFAEEKTLIDFSNYDEKLQSENYFQAQENPNPDGDQPAVVTEPGPENLDPSKEYKLSQDDMKLSSWLVTLNKSAKFPKNLVYSRVKPVTTKGKVGGSRTVLGARVHFPSWNFNSSAEISPSFPFPAYDASGQRAFVENGVLHNVGELQYINAEVYGRNFKHAFYVSLVNEAGKKSDYFMGFLFYDGWRRLTWANPNYISNVNNRELVRMPILPSEGVPFVKLHSFKVVRNAESPGGDFLIYIGKVNVKYDLAFAVDEEDIDDEETWGILAENIARQAKLQKLVISDLIENRRRALAKMGATAPADENENAAPAVNPPAGA